MSDDATPPPAPGSHGPLGPLALALSGGGYRAAAFHLGTLRFLDRMGLLRDVAGLSTVSGGTITGMAWAVSMLDGKPFSEFYDAYSTYLKQTNVIHEALEGLTTHRAHGSLPGRSCPGLPSSRARRPPAPRRTPAPEGRARPG
ncbi:conserved hypothetical protein, partial [Stigmatella aurantiaca DW4/3-1]